MKHCLSLHCFPFDPNVKKEWRSFIFNEVPDRVTKNLVLCSLHIFYHGFVYKFSERLKQRRWCADYIGLYSNVTTLFYINMRLFILSVITDCLIVLSIYAFSDQNQWFSNLSFCMSSSSNTPDYTHQLIRDCKTWSRCARYRETYKMCCWRYFMETFENHWPKSQQRSSVKDVSCQTHNC